MDSLVLNNGVKMPMIGLGTWNLRGEECSNVVAKALDMGYRMIDTAQMYENEEEVGRGIKNSSAPRGEVFLITKIYRPSNSYEKARRAIDDSLKRLGTDYADMLLLHEPYKEGTEMYRALEEALRKGKAKAIGISNYNEKWYSDIIKNVNVFPAVNQLESHVYFQKWDMQKLMEAKGTKMQAWSPLAQGIGSVAENAVLEEIGYKYNKTGAQVALRFLVQRGISVIPKSRHENRLKENMDIFDFQLTEKDIAAIRALDKNKTLFPWTEEF